MIIGFFFVWIGGFGLKTNCFVCILQNRSRVVGRVRRSWCTSKVDRTWNEFTWAQLFTLGERPKWSHSLSDEDDPLIRMCYWRHTVTTLCQLEVERREGKVPQLLWQHWWESFVWWPLVVAFCFLFGMVVYTVIMVTFAAVLFSWFFVHLRSAFELLVRLTLYQSGILL